jgi:hypothetical protein
MKVLKADLATRRAGIRARAILAIVCLALLGGCATAKAPVDEKGETPIPVRLALAPVIDMARVYGAHQGVRSPLTGKMFVTGDVAPEVAKLLTEATRAHLRDKGFEVVSPESMGSIMETLSARSDMTPGERPLIMAVARQVEVKAILVGYLYRVHGREGGRFAVRQPASLAYGFYLLDAGNGRILWSGEFDETQRSLAENLFAMGDFIRRRGEWVSADRMAADSLPEILADFPVREGADSKTDTP